MDYLNNLNNKAQKKHNSSSNINDIMRISYLSPKKDSKTFSFRNMKPVLIFTADKPKENKKEKDNNNFSPDNRKKFFSQSPNVIKENLYTEIDYNSNKPKIISDNNKNLNFLQNGNFYIFQFQEIFIPCLKIY